MLDGGVAECGVVIHCGADVPAAGSALNDGPKAPPILLIEIGVEDGVDAGVGGAEPLGDRRGKGKEPLLPRLHGLSSQFDPDEDGVKG